jgi:hypothetical protein
MTRRQIEHLKGQTPVGSSAEKNKAFVFSMLPLHEELQACVDVVDSLAVALRSPTPVMSHFIHRLKPKMRRALKLKDQLLERNIALSVKRLEEGSQSGEKRSICAVDQILLREKAGAKKAGMEPHYNRPTIKDEVSNP